MSTTEQSERIRARVGYWASRVALLVILGAMIAFVSIFVAHLPPWVLPPHYPPMSPAYTPPFSAPGLTFIPIEGWAALAVAIVAWSVRGSIERS